MIEHRLGKSRMGIMKEEGLSNVGMGGQSRGDSDGSNNNHCSLMKKSSGNLLLYKLPYTYI